MSTVNETLTSPSATDLVPRLLRPLSKTQPTEQTGPVTPASGRWNLATPVAHLTALRQRLNRVPPQHVEAEGSPQTCVDDGPTQSSPELPPFNTFSKRFQDMISTIPSIASTIGSGSFQASSPVSPQIAIETGENTPGSAPATLPSPPQSPWRNFHLLSLPSTEDSEHGWQSVWTTLDRLRPSFGKKPETVGSPEPSQTEVLDCLDDNNSVMMYGPLEPDETSEVEIACSEIVSMNGDGEEIRTPQPHFSPLPSESGDEILLGCGMRSPPPRNIPLPLESINQMLLSRSPRPRFAPLPMDSIDQVLMGGGGGESVSGQVMEREVSGASGVVQATPPTPPIKPAVDKPPTKEYRVWLPSLTKLSVQTMWWGFRIYLPPPVLDILNNKQLEAAKRAAIITTALQWLMEHLPISLLPPQMHPGVTVLRHLVPYVGYIGGFVAWGWSAIRSFDKGYGVVLTATWLLPFLLIPGTWEADEVPNQNTGTRQSPTASP